MTRKSLKFLRVYPSVNKREAPSAFSGLSSVSEYIAPVPTTTLATAKLSSHIIKSHFHQSRTLSLQHQILFQNHQEPSLHIPPLTCRALWRGSTLAQRPPEHEHTRVCLSLSFLLILSARFSKRVASWRAKWASCSCELNVFWLWSPSWRLPVWHERWCLSGWAPGCVWIAAAPVEHSRPETQVSGSLFLRVQITESSGNIHP